MNQKNRHRLSGDPRKLLEHIDSRLAGAITGEGWMSADDDGIQGSAVLFLLTRDRDAPARKPEFCLLLTKRSHRVVQPGDLCCPGGGITTGDKILSAIGPLPFAPLKKWLRWLRWRMAHRRLAHRVMQVWSAGLRESWEEMHLNPLRVTLLGLLPVQQLILFRRQIFPLAAWVPGDPHLSPNREVARIVKVPLRSLLDPGNYGRYRLTYQSGQSGNRHRNEFPCFIHHGRQGSEVLWGATYRIAMDFLGMVFDFHPPVADDLPVVRGSRDAAYFNGSIWDAEMSRQPER
jgi:hypothetical protein